MTECVSHSHKWQKVDAEVYLITYRDTHGQSVRALVKEAFGSNYLGIIGDRSLRAYYVVVEK